MPDSRSNMWNIVPDKHAQNGSRRQRSISQFNDAYVFHFGLLKHLKDRLVQHSELRSKCHSPPKTFLTTHIPNPRVAQQFIEAAENWRDCHPLI
jgi:hypothetical protein